jgi:hypothetical protein
VDREVGEEPDTLLFARRDGSPWRLDDWDNWRNRHFHEATRAVGLGTPRPYDLRHSFASLLIREQRVSIVDLADMLGHAPTMTLDTYSHVMREHRGQPPVAAETWITTADAASAAAAPRTPHPLDALSRCCRTSCLRPRHDLSDIPARSRVRGRSAAEGLP